MKKTILLVILSVLFACNHSKDKIILVDYVDPLIGTAPSSTVSALKHGQGTENNSQVVPFVTAPFGMTNWTAQTRDTETKCIAPYYYTDSLLQGFRGSHWLSGSCVQDYGSMTIMPLSGDLICQPDRRASGFRHENESASPNFYSVYLDDYGILTEMTATARCGFFRFRFDRSGQAHIVLNPNSDESQGFINIIPENNEIEVSNPVHRIYQGWGEEAGFSGHFVVRFNKAFDEYGCFAGDSIFPMLSRQSGLNHLGAFVSFKVEKGEEIEVFIGSSFSGLEYARMNLEVETKGLVFNTAVKNLESVWEGLLRKVQVEGGSRADMVKFYTAMYHTFLHPRVFSDCDGTYRSFAGGEKLLNSGDGEYYTDFSMWDTWRATLPLFNLLVPEVSKDMMQSLLLMAEQGGWLPIFPCWNSYTSAMIGDHVIVSIADAVSKGIIEPGKTDMDYMVKNAFTVPDDYQDYLGGKGRRALASYMEYGYVPLEDSVLESFHKNEQVSRTLEYAFDDFALGKLLAGFDYPEESQALLLRAQNYKNVYSMDDSCVRARYKDGAYVEELDKFNRVSWITEGTPLQYTWFVPHDIEGLIRLMGGEDGFNANLDAFHEAGQYWHGNEPGHHIPFLYNYSGQPWKTQELVTQIMEEEYGTGPGGLSGNDDAGQMSAWYVFAALGFYPVCPSVPEYVISGPHFDRIWINRDTDHPLLIEAKGASEGKNYILDLKLNSERLDRTFITHSELMGGGLLKFHMSDSPDREWGTSGLAKPFSVSREIP